MARKPATSSNTPSVKSNTTATSAPSQQQQQQPPKPSTSSLSARSSPQDVITGVWNDYLQNTPSRTFLLDAFMAFLVVIGAIQFLYAVLFGNYPFNAFLSGFCAAVGQFVLLVSLRMQTIEKLPATASAAEVKGANARKMGGASGGPVEKEGEKSKELDRQQQQQQQQQVEKGLQISSERAFAEFVFGSLILHGFCVNFIN